MIAIGTAQFGMKYGITNRSGQTSFKEVEDISSYAKMKGINILDTAPGYGDAEKVLGNIDLTGFDIITKTPHFKNDNIKIDDITLLLQTFEASLKALKVNKVKGMLIHNIKDCYKNGSDTLFEALIKLKKNNYVDKIGVSIYDPQDIEQIIHLGIPVDIIQMPINVFDQRIITSGWLPKLKEKNVDIHVRSIFLQGILLAELNDLQIQHQKIVKGYFEELYVNQLTKLEGALLFLKQIKEIDSIIVGVNNLQQFKEIIETYEKIMGLNIKFDFDRFAINDSNIIDPRKW